MDTYHPLHHPQHSNPPLPTTPPGYPPTHYLPAVARQTHNQHDDFNKNWGPAQEQLFSHYLHQIADGGSSAEAATPVNNLGHRCQWLTGNTLCTQVSDSFDELILHLATAHDVQGSAGRKMVCWWCTNEGYCGRVARRDGMRRHIAKHLRCTVSCTVCGKSFSRKDSMRAHKKKKHSTQ